MRILAVDDDPLVLGLLKEVLSAAGYDDLTTRPDAQAALELVRGEHEHFECILLDIQMPGMSGIDLCAALRAIPAYAGTPILMITSLSDKTNVTRAFAAGATDYVTKPFDGVELGARVRLAFQLVQHQRREGEDRSQIAELRAQLGGGVTAQVLSPVSGLPGAVSFHELDQYAKELPRGVFAMKIFGLRLSNAEELRNSHTAAVFDACVTRTGEALGRVLGHRPFLYSYMGEGLFLCIVNGRCGLTAASLQDSLQLDLKRDLPRARGGAPVVITVDTSDSPGGRVYSAATAATALAETVAAMRAAAKRAPRFDAAAPAGEAGPAPLQLTSPLPPEEEDEITLARIARLASG